MFGIKHFKAESIEYARIRVRGEKKKEGQGISGFYIPFHTTIEVVSLSASDQPFSFKEVTRDKQEVALQGGLVYRIADPQKVMEQYNFAINPKNRQYLTEDPKKIPQHILQIVRSEAKTRVQNTSLEEVLVMGKDLANDIATRLNELPIMPGMGVEFRNLYFDSIVPNPEIGKALEADYRERLLQKADKVIYERRVQAVENERKIKEQEMETDTQMEQRRKQLVELKGQNALREAESRAKALETEGKGKANVVIIDGDARAKTIFAVGEAEAAALQKKIEVYAGVDPLVIGAQALVELGKTIKIGDVSITPEILTSLGEAVKYFAKKNGDK